MGKNLLEKSRVLNSLIQNSNSVNMSFSRLCKNLQAVLEANVYIVSKRGKILGSRLLSGDKCKDHEAPRSCNDELLNIKCTRMNIKKGIAESIFEKDIGTGDFNSCVIPVIGNSQRLGTLVLIRSSIVFDDDDTILAEFAATLVGLEIQKAKSDEVEHEERKKSVVTMAIATLSYSELDAVNSILEELGGLEGKLVAGRIADKVGITRSVIVNALRKIESAGIIESRSLGMKGTYIKVLNDKIFDELKRCKLNRMY